MVLRIIGVGRVPPVGGVLPLCTAPCTCYTATPPSRKPDEGTSGGYHSGTHRRALECSGSSRSSRSMSSRPPQVAHHLEPRSNSTRAAARMHTGQRKSELHAPAAGSKAAMGLVLPCSQPVPQACSQHSQAAHSRATPRVRTCGEHLQQPDSPTPGPSCRSHTSQCAKTGQPMAVP
jgi:hypothetical protein